ncbi:MAG: cyclase family protein [Spirochaetales bacterium]|nr:cyclase family protein [Spirochaetales bacterium]
MKIIDLTHEICQGMPVFPGTEPPVLLDANTFENSGFREKKISMYSHTGTHIDAPAHMLKEGVSLDRLDISHFMGEAFIFDFSKNNSKQIEIEDLKPYEDKLKHTDFLIIKTGWDQYWGDDKYYEDFPALSLKAAEWLAEFNLKGLGVDSISIDPMSSTDFEVHKILLARNILSIENLTNLDSIKGERFTLSILPLKSRDADGSPVRAVAMEF